MAIPENYIHTNSLMRNIADMKEMYDVTLVAGIDKQRYQAHRVVLMASSKYFVALLGPNFREGTAEEIPLQEIDGPMLKTILDFIYSGQIEINEENVARIIAAAFSMELIALEERCGEFWKAKMLVENCVEIFLNADTYRLMKLRAEALKFICYHFGDTSTDDFEEMNEENIREILEQDGINAPETMVFDILVQWLDQNVTNEGRIASKMLKLIRLNHIPNEFLIENVRPVFEKYGCERMVINEYQKRLRNSKPICLQRYSPEAILCAAPNTSQDAINIQKYDFIENNWNEFKSFSLDTRREQFGSIQLNGQLYVMGGLGPNNTHINKVESYNLTDLTKTILLPMQNARRSFTPISVGKYIYAFGGINGPNYVFSCERFDIEKRLWESRKSVPNRMIDYAAIEFDGKIYVAAERIFYCYDPDIDAWETLNKMSFEPSLGKTNELIYAIEPNWTLHNFNTNNRTWTTIGWFGNFGSIVGTVSHCNQIYLLCKEGKFEALATGDKSIFIRLDSTNAPVRNSILISN